MPEIREILIVVNTAEVREGAQAVNQLADASGQAGRQVRETSVAIRISEQVTRAQEEATRAAADAARVLGGRAAMRPMPCSRRRKLLTALPGRR